jgi:WD40 repeat protein
VLRAIEVSIEALGPIERELYRQFAVFRDQGSVPQPTIEVLWESNGIDNYETEYYVSLFVDRSLARRDETGRISLHDLQMDYICHELDADRLSHLHNQLLNAYARRSPGGWQLGPADGYYFEHLAHHLIVAGRESELSGLLLSFSWIEAKLERSGLLSLLHDYSLLSSPTLRLVERALRLSAAAVLNDTTQLAGQLIGRLLNYEATEIQELVDDARKQRRTYWLCPVTQSLESPMGALLRTIRAPYKLSRELDVTPDGKKAIVSADDGSIRLWDLEAGLEMRPLRPTDRWYRALRISRDSRNVISISEQGTLRVWDSKSSEEVQQFILPPSIHSSYAMSTDGRHLVGCKDEVLTAWDLHSREELILDPALDEPVLALIATLDGNGVISASMSGLLTLWDLKRLKKARDIGSTNSWVTALAVSPDGRRVVAGSIDGTISVWDSQSCKRLCRIFAHDARVIAVGISKDGSRIVSCPRDGQPILWSVEDARQILTLRGHGGPVAALVVADEVSQAISISNDNTLRLWDLNARQGETADFHSARVNGLSVVPGKNKILSISEDGAVKAWNTEAPVGPRTFHSDRLIKPSVWTRPSDWPSIGEIEESTRGIQSLTIAAEETRVVTRSGDLLELWNVETGMSLGTSRILSSGSDVQNLYYEADPVCLASIGRSRRIILGLKNGTLRLCVLWNPLDSLSMAPMLYSEDIERIEPLGAPSASIDSSVRALAVAPGGERLVSGSEDGRVYVWKMSSSLGEADHPTHYVSVSRPFGTGPTLLYEHNAPVNALAISPDGGVIASGSTDGELRVWRLQQAKEIFAIKAHQESISAVDFSADGRWVASSSIDATSRIWDAGQGIEIARFTGDAGITACVMVPGRRPHLVCGDATGRIHFLDLHHGEDEP